MNTNGSWIFRPKSSTFHHASDTHPYGEQVFGLVEGHNDEMLPSEEIIALIGAAPDLREAMRELTEATEYLMNRAVETKGVRCMDEAAIKVAKARAALQRADGEGS